MSEYQEQQDWQQNQGQQDWQQNQGQQQQDWQQNQGQVEGQQNQEQAEGQKQETPTREGAKKITPASYASIRAHNMVKGKYNFTQISSNGKKLFILESSSPNFDRILRRSPREVNKNADLYDVPLGVTCSEAIVCAYGLSYGVIYSDDTWLRLINNYNSKKTFKNAQSVLEFLHSAAILKYLALCGDSFDTKHTILFVQKIQQVKDCDIIDNFYEMVR